MKKHYKKIIALSIIAIACIAACIYAWKYQNPYSFENSLTVYDVGSATAEEAVHYSLSYSLEVKRELFEKDEMPAVLGWVEIDDNKYEVQYFIEYEEVFYFILKDADDDSWYPEHKAHMRIMADGSHVVIWHEGIEEYCMGPASSYEEAKGLQEAAHAKYIEKCDE